MEINTPIGLSTFAEPIFDTTDAAQLDTGAIIHTGAAVESIIYASFARDTLFLSVIGFITAPIVRQLK